MQPIVALCEALSKFARAEVGQRPRALDEHRRKARTLDGLDSYRKGRQRQIDRSRDEPRPGEARRCTEQTIDPREPAPLERNSEPIGPERSRRECCQEYHSESQKIR